MFFQKQEIDKTQNKIISKLPIINATTTFLHQVKQSSPNIINLLSPSSQQMKATTGTKTISIAKTSTTNYPSVNTGTTTIVLPVFNTVRDLSCY